ncbi:MAG: hydroxyacid dehydrogenase [Erysipelotrichaceae bacterium]|nr:hydroxyacid dehydrogenase [Erysipelotrichaceae bacterium]
MKISLLEPLGVPAAVIESYGKKLSEAGHEFVYYDTKTTDPAELAKRSEGAEIVMIANNPYPASVVNAAKDLKMLDVAFTGIDHVALDACKEAGVTVCNASGYSTETVAELVLAMAVAGLRKMREGDIRTRSGQTAAGLGGREIAGRTVGIIGLGHIGLRAAELFLAFGAKVIAFNRSVNPKAVEMGITYKTLDEVLQESDIISLNLPNNKETKGIISAEKIALMKNDAVFINCARGPIVDNAALAAALNNDELGYACIDVYDGEPPLAEDYPLLHAKNTLLTPHQGFISEEAMLRRAEIVFANVDAYLKGEAINVCKL